MNTRKSRFFATSVLGNSQLLDGGAMFGNAPAAVWKKWHQPDEQNRIALSCRCFLFGVGDKLILVETGIGAFFEPKLANRFGVQEANHCLIDNLSKAGVAADDIDFVILSHLHFDHAGGLLPAFDAKRVGIELLFKNATYVVGKTAWERSVHPHPRDKASFIDGLAEALRDSQRLVLVEDSAVAPKELTDLGLEFMFTHGHTPGHMHTILRTEQQNLRTEQKSALIKPETYVFAGDLIPGESWIHLPITMGYDRYAELVIDEKKAFLDRAISEDWTVLYTHDPKLSASKIELKDGKYVAHDKMSDLDLKF